MTTVKIGDGFLLMCRPSNACVAQSDALWWRQTIAKLKSTLAPKIAFLPGADVVQSGMPDHTQ